MEQKHFCYKDGKSLYNCGKNISVCTTKDSNTQKICDSIKNTYEENFDIKNFLTCDNVDDGFKENCHTCLDKDNEACCALCTNENNEWNTFLKNNKDNIQENRQYDPKKCKAICNTPSN